MGCPGRAVEDLGGQQLFSISNDERELVKNLHHYTPSITKIKFGIKSDLPHVKMDSLRPSNSSFHFCWIEISWTKHRH